MNIGDAVYVTENFRARGKIGGWAEHTWEGVVVKVNRTTVDVVRVQAVTDKRPDLWHNVKKEQVEPR